MKAGLLSERASYRERMREGVAEARRGKVRRDRCKKRWKKKSLQKVKSDQAEGCTIVQGMKALD